MFGAFKRKALFAGLAIADAVLLGTAITLARKLIKKTAHQEVVNTIIKENEEQSAKSDENHTDIKKDESDDKIDGQE